ncbi:hypothetical protein M128_1118 [Bacteroides fragilis str. S6L8]|uniref:Uncharacterized protein n=1 Tax=Bacteroides fragilis str. 3998T(B)3 TaxID=1339316 RepID=A0A015XGG9_BACFG|nr:hypothetical protein M125_1591 [Bacteroides fragilis str. 3998T(B)3]EXY96615.1 hypothetical protein M081_1222 [Bacteroides fragilis str. 3998 T(B) 4]EYA67532.1 hypothetical protein M139_1128 [Bacteroides fragilis str. S23L24]EYA72215.1 hypothetical protein M132_0975 [Bacteroides fragilis str. S24L15]EYA86882.1 hypothetical protein M137_1236 [Bacteroides fragilis str. S36L12]EYB01564.1 hypothetical protein M128_1118 [Bacteroides fragilis str. S6L8]EYB05996.1 hypothetical protein M129_1411 [
MKYLKIGKRRMPVGTNSIKIISSTSEWLFTPCISEGFCDFS